MGTDPDPGFRIRIRMRIRIQQLKLMRIHAEGRRAKMTQKIEKRTEFSSFEVLDVLFRGLMASPVAWASFMEA